MEQSLTKEQKELLKRVIESSYPLKDIETLNATGKQQLGVSYRIDNGIHIYTDEGWVHLFNVDDTEAQQVAAAEVLSELQGVLVADAQHQQQQLVKAMEGARVVDNTDEMYALENPEEGQCVAIGSLQGDIYRWVNAGTIVKEFTWSLIRKGRDLAEEKALQDADNQMTARAVDVAAGTVGLVAPSMNDWVNIMEPVDTQYPSMFDDQGVRLPEADAAALHAQYLDTQRRVMLTKSAMVTFGGNSKDSHEFTVDWMEQQLLQKMGIQVTQAPAENNPDVQLFTARVELPGLRCDIMDTHYRTLLVRILHFIATRHDPDTDAYVNARLKEFANMPDPKAPRH